MREHERHFQQLKHQNERLTCKVEELLEAKKELKHAKKAVTGLTEENKKMEHELENKLQIDDAIEYLRQSNQKVTNRCSELESQLARRDHEAAELEQQLKMSESQNALLREQNAELQVEIDRIRYQSNDLNNSVLNMSTLSVNQQMVADMQDQIARLENENSRLRAAKSDKIQTVVLEQEQLLHEKDLEVRRLAQANDRLEKQAA